MREPTIGAITHGTLRPEDLLESYASQLWYLIRESPAEEVEGDVILVNEARQLLEDDGTLKDNTEAGCEEAGFVLEALHDRLNELAPPLCYFGAHEGDGSCIGFWPREDIPEIEDVLVIDGSRDFIPDYILVDGERGNMSLYRVTYVWGV